MNFDRNPRLVKVHAAGFTLIELMIAVTLMLLVTFAVISIYVPTRSTAKVQTGVARMNENWQAASENIAREFRELSFMGCVSLGNRTAGDDPDKDSTIKHDQLRGTRGYSTTRVNSLTVLKQVGSSDPSAPSNAIAGQPIVVVNHAANKGAHLLATMVDRGDSGIRFKSDPGFKMDIAGFLAVISDCKAGEIFKVGGSTIPLTAANNWRITPFSQLRAAYDVDSRVAPLSTTQFYLAPAPRASDERSSTALYRRTLLADGVTWATPYQIARDVTSMQVTAAVDADNDYVPEAANVPWDSTLNPERVVAINLTLGLTGPPDTKANGTALTRSFTAYITARSRAL
jgi:type IV pilus assembly protein PilW